MGDSSMQGWGLTRLEGGRALLIPGLPCCHIAHLHGRLALAQHPMQLRRAQRWELSSQGRPRHLGKETARGGEHHPVTPIPNPTQPAPHLQQLGAGHGQQVGHAGQFSKELLGELLKAGSTQPLQQQPHAGSQLHALRPMEAAERGACGAQHRLGNGTPTFSQRA